MVISINNDNVNTEGLELKDEIQNVNGNFIEMNMSIIPRWQFVINGGMYLRKIVWYLHRYWMEITSESTFKSMVKHNVIKRTLINKHKWLENMAERPDNYNLVIIEIEQNDNKDNKNINDLRKGRCI